MQTSPPAGSDIREDTEMKTRKERDFRQTHRMGRQEGGNISQRGSSF